MDTTLLELKLVLDYVGAKADMGSFADRSMIQKMIYLTQILGVDLGYRFGWNLRGPYSRALTRDAFVLRDELLEGNSEHADYRLKEEIEHRLDRVGELAKQPDAFDGTSEEWIELLASLHFLRHIAYRPEGSDRGFEEAFRLLIESKPQFTAKETQALQAWDRLDESGLIHSKVLVCPR